MIPPEGGSSPPASQQFLLPPLIQSSLIIRAAYCVDNTLAKKLPIHRRNVRSINTHTGRHHDRILVVCLDACTRVTIQSPHVRRSQRRNLVVCLRAAPCYGVGNDLMLK